MSDKDIITGLRATFDLHDHELRPLITKDNFTRWSVYIRREAITNRLDDLFGPFEWEFEINQRVERSGYVAYNGAIVIKGHRRANNGGASGADENADKAALTDCFKRCASSWGIGLYLQNTPDIMTGAIGKSEGSKFRVNYTQQASMEAEALKKFAEWWQTLTPGNTDKAPTTTITPPQNGTQAPPEPAPQTGITESTYVKVRTTKTGGTFYVAEGDVYSFKRQPYRDAGLIVDHWTEVGKKYAFGRTLALAWETNENGNKVLTHVEPEAEAKAS